MQPSFDSRGFSIIELLMVVLVMGIVIAMSIPAYQKINQDWQVKGATQAISGRIQLARARAMATGVTQTVNCDTTVAPNSLWILNGTQNSTTWPLPRGLQFDVGSGGTFNITSDGRASTSRTIVLRNLNGRRDTVSVEVSGLVLVR